jgi:hypothetical protein
MRKLRPSVASSTYQHRVVFQYHGVPPLAWWDEWEVLADQRYPRGSVQVIDFRSRNLSHKRRRKKNANCIKCGLLVHQRYDGWCKDCVDIEQKAKENMEKNIRRRNELLERDLESATARISTVALENEELKTTCAKLQDDIDSLSSTIKATTAAHCSAITKAIALEQGKASSQLFSICRAHTDILNSNMKLQETQAQLRNDIVRLSNSMNVQYQSALRDAERHKKIVDQLRSNNDSKGLFAKAVLMDLWTYGIKACSSKTRNYGTNKERVGNIAKYNSILKPLIDRVIGMDIPITKNPEDGKCIDEDDLAFRLRQRRLDFSFARIDILYKGKSCSKTQLYQLYNWYKRDRHNNGVYENNMNEPFVKAEFYSKLSNNQRFFQDIFCALHQYHVQHGMQQTDATEKSLLFDYGDYTFYRNELIRMSYCKEATMLHMKTYCHTRQYTYEEPSLITNDH